MMQCWKNKGSDEVSIEDEKYRLVQETVTFGTSDEIYYSQCT